jgi:hypothetical protein
MLAASRPSRSRASRADTHPQLGGSRFPGSGPPKRPNRAANGSMERGASVSIRRAKP